MEPEQRTAATAPPRTVPAHELRIVGGNAALDLCNSRSGPHDGGTDLDAIVQTEHIVPWALHAGVITPGEADELTRGAASSPAADATESLAALLLLREQAHAVFAALAAGGEPGPAELDALRRADLAATGRAEQVRVGDHFDFAWPASTTAVVDRVAHAAAELLHDGPLSRVKLCAGCSFLFVDESKNGSRRWCSMDDCGREAKMRLYVERRRARSEHPPEHDGAPTR